MKIIVIHYRYYLASGPERYLFNFKKLFECNGHEIIPFSINYNENMETKYREYFVSPVGSHENFHLNEISNLSINNKIRIIKNLFFNKEAYKKLNLLINAKKPDLIYVLQYYGKLSPSIFKAAKKNNLPVIHRLSDFNLLCAKNIFYVKNKVCTKCIKYEINGIINKCTQDSYLKSLITYFARKYFYLKKFQYTFDAIISPSKFTANIFKNHKSYKTHNIVHLPTFIWENEIVGFDRTNKIENKVFCYFGRIAYDKGIKTLLEAFKMLKHNNIEPKLLIIGDDNTEYGKSLKRLANKWNLGNVIFNGFMNKKQLLNSIKSCSFSIVPSVWYDNMPNSLVESQAMGIPVIASDIGSLKELVTEGYNGFLFEANNAQELAEKINNAINFTTDRLTELKQNSLNWVQEYCSEEKHYKELLKTFEDCIKRKEETRKP